MKFEKITITLSESDIEEAISKLLMEKGYKIKDIGWVFNDEYESTELYEKSTNGVRSVICEVEKKES